MIRRKKKKPRLRKQAARGGVDAFHRAVWRVVRRIPRGKVSTYGEVAALAGFPRAARAAGRALATLPGPMSRTVPWQRVVNAAGKISFRGDGMPSLQRELLEREGVAFGRGGRIDLRRYGWSAARGRPGRSQPKRTPRPGRHADGGPLLRRGASGAGPLFGREPRHAARRRTAAGHRMPDGIYGTTV